MSYVKGLKRFSDSVVVPFLLSTVHADSKDANAFVRLLAGSTLPCLAWNRWRGRRWLRRKVPLGIRSGLREEGVFVLSTVFLLFGLFVAHLRGFQSTGSRSTMDYWEETGARLAADNVQVIPQKELSGDSEVDLNPRYQARHRC